MPTVKHNYSYVRVQKPLCHVDSTDSCQAQSTTKFCTPDGVVYVVYRQPIALDRYTVHDVTPPDSIGSYINDTLRSYIELCRVDHRRRDYRPVSTRHTTEVDLARTSYIPTHTNANFALGSDVMRGQLKVLYPATRWSRGRNPIGRNAKKTRKTWNTDEIL